MTHPMTSIQLDELRHVIRGSVSDCGFGQTVEVDGPAAPPVFTGSKMRSI